MDFSIFWYNFAKRNMVEQANYPYKPGLYGIPFNNIEMNVHRLIRGGSGRRLSVLITKSGIDVEDEQDPWFYLRATVRKKTLYMELYTRKSSAQETHPDFFAGKFVDFAMKYFNNNRVNIRFFQAMWFRDSENEATNYDQFMQHFNLTRDEKEAVRRTWTAQMIKSYGFDAIISVARINGIEEDSEHIDVLFAKTKS